MSNVQIALDTLFAETRKVGPRFPQSMYTTCMVNGVIDPCKLVKRLVEISDEKWIKVALENDRLDYLAHSIALDPAHEIEFVTAFGEHDYRKLRILAHMKLGMKFRDALALTA